MTGQAVIYFDNTNLDTSRGKNLYGGFNLTEIQNFFN